jgi:hypothetical protein
VFSASTLASVIELSGVDDSATASNAVIADDPAAPWMT